MSAKEGKLLLPGEVARLYRVSRRTVYRWIRRGKLPAIPDRLGRRPRHIALLGNGVVGTLFRFSSIQTPYAQTTTKGPGKGISIKIAREISAALGIKTRRQWYGQGYLRSPGDGRTVGTV